MTDQMAGSHDGDTAETSGLGSSAGTFAVPLPASPNIPPSFGAPPEVASQDAPDRPDLLRSPAPEDPAGGPADPADPLTTQNAAALLHAHGAHHIRPRPRHA